MKTKNLLLALLVSFSFQAYSQSMKVGDIATQAVDNVYQNDFRMIEARNGCYRLGYLRSQVELLKYNTELGRKSQRNLKKALKKTEKGMKECRNGVGPKTAIGAIFKLLFPQTKTGRSAYRTVKKLLKAQRYNREVDNFSYNNSDLVRSAQDALMPALDEKMRESHRCLLIGQANADAMFIRNNISNSNLQKAIKSAVQDLNDSCGTTMGERRYQRRINKLLDVLKRI